jgi:23S rRNA pseudouridine2605 synthase
MAENTTPAAPVPAGATPAGERIAKVLSRAGVASRREAERLIELGEVTVNGKVITSPALNVTAADRITVMGRTVGAPEPPRLWLYYKPEGLVTSEADEKGRQTVFDNLPEDMPRVMSIGRLDLNSEGLLLLTNDGALKRRLELPATGWLRKYRVRVNGNPVDPDLEPLRKGIVVEGEKFQAMNVVIDRIQGANAWLTVGLREGKNREIRRALSALGLTVNRLIRISYGPFRLNDLLPGQVEEVKPRVLKEQLGLGDMEFEDSKRPPKPAARPAAKPAEAPAKKTGRGPRVAAPGTTSVARVRVNPQTRGEAAALRIDPATGEPKAPRARSAAPAKTTTKAPRKAPTRNAPAGPGGARPGSGRPKRGE